MSIPVTHRMKLVEREVSDGVSCRFSATCSCNWQGLAHALDRIEAFIDYHKFAQTVRGNPVIIERELLPKAEPDAKA